MLFRHLPSPLSFLFERKLSQAIARSRSVSRQGNGRFGTDGCQRWVDSSLFVMFHENETTLLLSGPPVPFILHVRAFLLLLSECMLLVQQQ